MVKNCLICNKEFETKYKKNTKEYQRRKCCSLKCFHQGMKGNKRRLGIKHSECIKQLMSEKHRGKNNPHWKGGKKRNGDGYISIHCPNHPFISKDNYVMEHRLIMEAHLGRTLLPTEIVHHINGIRDDNRIENLMLFSTIGKHIKYHNERRMK